MTHNAHPDLAGLLVPLHTVYDDPENAKGHDDRNLAAIMDSLRRFGQDVPLVASSATRVVYAGNGRLEAMRRLGWTHAAVVFRDDPDLVMAARGLADNRTAELSTWNPEHLAAALDMVREADPRLAVGWTPFEVSEQIAAVTPPPPPDPLPPAAFPEYDEAIACEHACPNCGYRWSGNPNPG